MDALRLMERLRGEGDEINDIEEKIQIRRDAAMSTTARYGSEGGGGGSAGDKMSAYAAEVDELLTRKQQVRKRWQAEMDVCVKLCDRFDGVKRKVLYQFYGKAWKLSAVAENNGYTAGYVRNSKRELDDELKRIEIPWTEE